MIIEVLNDQEGAQMNVTENKTRALKASKHGHQPIIGQLYDNNPLDARVKGPLEKSPTITAYLGIGSGHGPLVEEDPVCVHTLSGNANGKYYIEGGTPALNTVEKYGVATQKVVRRLTPLECERLQGLPDGWTEGGSDTARYKAIGNGMAQPCADFVMEKVVEAIGRGEGNGDKEH